jgi:hypothetical protein
MTNGAGQTGSIRVITNPGGARILLAYDNTTEEIVPATPFTIAGKEPGTYTVTVTKGDVSNSKEVKVEAGSTTTAYITILTKENVKKIRFISIYTVICIAILTGIAIFTQINYLSHLGTVNPLDNLIKELIFVACAGGLGGLAFNIYVYVDHIGRVEDFRLEYAYSYYLRPFLGTLYGVFVFFLFAGGLMTLSGTSAPVADGLFTTKSVMFYIALSFLAGYGEEPVSIQLKALAEGIFKEPPKENKTTTQEKPE